MNRRTFLKKIAVAGKAGDPYILPSIDSVNAGTYAIARPLFMYTNGEPTGEIKAYLDWILSPAGQQIVADLGFVPLK